ncbi:MAG: enoyl-CoA hydratase/isomerase family protein [Jatrophihabitantaceae bacterium]
MSDADRVATFTLNRPAKRNVQNPLTWAWLSRTVNALPGTVRMLVVRGEGSSFSAGLDRAMFTPEGIEGIPSVLDLARADHDEASAEIAGYQHGLAVFARPGLVSLALVQGHAVGAGFQLSLACDVRIAAEDAQFSMAEVSIGLVPDLGGTKRLLELVGYSRAAEICLTGRRVDAAEALRIGLVSSVVNAAELAAAGERFTSRILDQPVAAVTEIKALLLAASGRSQAEQERAEREAQHRQLRALAGLDE